MDTPIAPSTISWMIALALQGLLVLGRPIGEPPLDPLDERVDHRGFHLGAEFVPRLDRGLEVFPRARNVAHGPNLATRDAAPERPGVSRYA